jgi:CheY-like chemotaxis protein
MEQRKILIVDDEAGLRELVRINLEHEGYGVVQAENGVYGLEAVREEHPDLVIMDVMMPEMDGYETTRAIRQDPRFRSLPIIALTAKAMKGDREKCIAAGASDYITKPVDTEQLLSLMRVWLYR